MGIKKKIKQILEKRIENELNLLNLTPISECNKDDIFIAGYPKSGNTWLKTLIASILLETSTERLTPTLVNEIIPDVHGKKYYRRLYPQTFFKTHHLPQANYKKVIHLVRDGRDSMVSYFKMEKSKLKSDLLTIESMVVDGEKLFPSKWYYHTKKWIENPFNSEILVVKYEDLKENTFNELKKICVFSNLNIEDDLLEKIIKQNEIGAMRSRFSKYGVENEKMFKNNDISVFFRKGNIGDYKNEMSEDLIEFFNKEAYNELQYFDYSL